MDNRPLVLKKSRNQIVQTEVHVWKIKLVKHTISALSVGPTPTIPLLYPPHIITLKFAIKVENQLAT